jgi:hypothetical protein
MSNRHFIVLSAAALAACVLGVPIRGGGKKPEQSPHVAALELVFKTQQARIRELDPGDWWMDVKEREWVAKRPFYPGGIDSTHLFRVSYRVGGKEVAAWVVDTRAGKVHEDKDRAAEKPADVDAQSRRLAEDAARQFARAFNERSVKRMAELAGLPFFVPPRPSVPTNFGTPSPEVKTEKELRAKLKEFAGMLPARVQTVVSYARQGQKLLVGGEDRKALDDVMGKDGLIVYLEAPGETGVFPVFVRVTGDRARVLGFLWTQDRPPADR